MDATMSMMRKALRTCAARPPVTAQSLWGAAASGAAVRRAGPV